MKNVAIALFLFFSTIPVIGQVKVMTGIDVLKATNFAMIQGKRVGLVTNPTGVDGALESDIDLLHQAEGVKLVALFGPEHGVRGSMTAGAKVADSFDEKTGVPVYSLYGKNRIPSAAMLKGIDVLIYDIQDIGSRSFTYISTLSNIMKVAARYHIPLIVLDRPNPLGGNKVEGCITEEDCVSFVSQLKIPYIYGLTVGELASLLNGERMLGKPCDLTVVKMEGWNRSMTYEQTALPWVLPSPHIPEMKTAYFYPMSGIIGELSTISIGVGYTLPFQLFAAEYIDASALASRLNQLGLEGVHFRSLYYTPYYGYGKGKTLKGVQVYITNYEKAKLTEVQFYVLQELYRMNSNADVLGNALSDRKRMFDLVCGSKQIRRLFMKRHRWEDVRQYWEKDVESFRQLSAKYYLY